MKKKRLFALALCLTLTLNSCGAFGASPFTYAANGSSTVYTFGDPNGPWPDLYVEHQKEVKRREKERKKAEREQAMREKAAMRKAAREARERERKDKAAKESA